MLAWVVAVGLGGGSFLGAGDDSGVGRKCQHGWEVADCWVAAWDGIVWASSETTSVWWDGNFSLVGRRCWCGMLAFLASKMTVSDGDDVEELVAVGDGGVLASSEVAAWDRSVFGVVDGDFVGR